ncbi:Uncharacterized protein Rs2_17741 [Raphanus sativus]|nr:Uncharacterized protein Rs2_17741 [Raphanus sativus]
MFLILSLSLSFSKDLSRRKAICRLLDLVVSVGVPYRRRLFLCLALSRWFSVSVVLALSISLSRWFSASLSLGGCPRGDEALLRWLRSETSPSVLFEPVSRWDFSLKLSLGGSPQIESTKRSTFGGRPRSKRSTFGGAKQGGGSS